MIDEKKLVSIIVPIYNVDKYLERCLESIIMQTYKNVEIILVNDGSTDKSDSICKEFLRKDNRIKYIKQKNQGLSCARNRGIKESNGDYYIFIDSDDYVNINFVEELYNTLIKTGSDVAVCKYRKVYDGECNILKKAKGAVKVYEGDKKFYNLYNNNSTITTVAWNKIYKKEIFSEIKYPCNKIHEDEFVVYDILKISKKVAYNTCQYYYYLQRKDGITGKYDKKRAIILEALYCRLEDLKKDNRKRLYSYTLYNYYYQLLYHYNMLNLYYPNCGEDIEKVYNEILKLKKEVLLNIHINPLKKIKLIIKLISLHC